MQRVCIENNQNIVRIAPAVGICNTEYRRLGTYTINVRIIVVVPVRYFINGLTGQRLRCTRICMALLVHLRILIYFSYKIFNIYMTLS